MAKELRRGIAVMRKQSPIKKKKRERQSRTVVFRKSLAATHLP